MIDFTRKESGTKKFFRKNGFYIALACCILASGAVAWKTLGNPGIKTQDEPPAPSVSDTAPGGIQNWENTLPEGEEADVKKNDEPRTEEQTESETESESETQETEPASMVNNELNTPYQSFYMMPCGTQIIADYSDGELVYSETMEDWRSHNGVDLKAGEGAKVKAINDGIVLNVYEDAMWGTVVEIDHGNKLVAKYCGLGKNPPVQKGSEVKMNTDIGVVGALPAEAAAGSHLHFEIRIDGKLVDPLAAMGKAE